MVEAGDDLAKLVESAVRDNDIAPTDGDILICADGASGELLWVISRTLGGNFCVVGHNSRHLYLSGSAGVMCVDHRTGIRLWEVEPPESTWWGRGIVTDTRTGARTRQPPQPGEHRRQVTPAQRQGTQGIE